MKAIFSPLQKTFSCKKKRHFNVLLNNLPEKKTGGGGNQKSLEYVQHCLCGSVRWFRFELQIIFSLQEINIHLKGSKYSAFLKLFFRKAIIVKQYYIF